MNTLRNFVHWLWSIGTIVSVITFASCSRSPIENSASELRIRAIEDMGTWDWNYGEVNIDIVNQMMEGLTRTDEQGNPRPGRAESWELKGNTWVFHLKKSTKWSDGTPLCAEHFQKSFKRLLTPGQSPYAHYFYAISGAKEFNTGQTKELSSITVDGCETLSVNMKEPIAHFPSLVSHWTSFPVRDDLQFTTEKIVTNGPYKLTRWLRNQIIELSVNEHYDGLSPDVKKIRFVIVPDDHTALKLFETKGLDWIEDIPLLDRRRLSSTPGYHSFPGLVGYYLGFNISRPPWNSKPLRVALAQSLDLSQIPKFLAGNEIPAEGWFPPPLATPNPARHIAFNPDSAAKTVKSLKLNRQERYSLTYYTKDIHTPVMEWAQEQWRKHLGLSIRLQPVEGKVYWSEIVKKQYAFFLSGVTAYFASPMPFLAEFLGDSHANWTNFASATYDSHIREASLETDSAKRMDHFLKAEHEVVVEQAAVIPLYFRSSSVLVNRTWKSGFWINPLTLYYINELRN